MEAYMIQSYYLFALTSFLVLIAIIRMMNYFDQRSTLSVEQLLHFDRIPLNSHLIFICEAKGLIKDNATFKIGSVYADVKSVAQNGHGS